MQSHLHPFCTIDEAVLIKTVNTVVSLSCFYNLRGSLREVKNVYDVQVRYWADSEGFHQEDNVPRDLPQPPQETEEVREARLAHEKAWEEAAAASRANPDPQLVFIFFIPFMTFYPSVISFSSTIFLHRMWSSP